METNIKLSIKFDGDVLSQDAYDLWRLTLHKGIKTDIGDARRINNRSWRLLSKNVLCNCDEGLIVQDLASNHLLRQPQDNTEVIPSKRSSLFSNNSLPSLFLKGSSEDLGIKHFVTTDLSDISDISEISEDDEDDQDDENDEDDEDDEDDQDDEEDEEDDEEDEEVDGNKAHVEPAGNGKHTNQVLNNDNHNYEENEWGSAQIKESSSSHDKSEKLRTSCQRMGSKETTITNASEATEINSVNTCIQSGTTSKNGGKNIFYISNSISPRTAEVKSFCSEPVKGINHVAETKNPKIKRQDSLFGNSGNIKLPNFADNEDGYSSTDISEDDEGSIEDNLDSESLCENGSYNIKRMDNNSNVSKQHVSGDEESEWCSLTSEEDKKLNTSALIFNKNYGYTDRKSSAASTSCQDCETQGNFNPRSRLSTLFLSELNSKNKSHKEEDSQKPTLKRSSTTGIITINQRKINDKNFSRKSNDSSDRPSILFSKKHASLSDISRNYPHFRNNLGKSNILDKSFETEDTAQFGSENNGSVVKQRSMVGISDFNVISKFSDSSRIDDNSTSESVIGNKSVSSADLNTLSSSLNKYSNHHLSASSIKNLLSKSTLSINYLLSSRRWAKQDNSKLNNVTQRESIENLNMSNSPKSCSKSDSTSTSSSSHIIIPPRHKKGEKSKLEVSQEDLVAPVDDKNLPLSAETSRRSMLSAELSQSLKDSIKIDYKLGKSVLPPRVVKGVNIVNCSNDDYSYDDYHSKGW